MGGLQQLQHDHDGSMQIDQPNGYALGMPRAYLAKKNSEYLEYYRQFIMSIIYMIEPEISKINPNIVDEINQLIDFNVKLANVRRNYIQYF